MLIREWGNAETSSANMSATVINQAARAAFLDDISRRFWQWYGEHQDDVLFTVFKFYKVRLRRLRGLLERIFGERPVELPKPGEVVA